jgi:uncharacterized membrane protein
MPITILFDTSHQEEIILDAPELSQLSLLLKKNGFTVHPTTLSLEVEDLASHQVIVLGNPLDSKFTSTEVAKLETFVQSGGGLLVLSGATIFGKGGDVARNSNLNAVIKPFALEFSDTAIGTTLSRGDAQEAASEDMITATPAAQHPTVVGLRNLLFTSATSIKSGDKAHQLLRASGHPGSPVIAAATEVKKGRVLVVGGTTPFFNDFIETEDHSAFIVQTFRWLAGASAGHRFMPLKTQSTIEGVEPTSADIEELRTQLNQIEEELQTLKKVIHSSLKMMEKVVRKVQENEKDTD